MMNFSNTALSSALAQLNASIKNLESGNKLSFTAADPDNCIGCYAGKSYTLNDKEYIHRSWHNWSTLAQLLGCRMLTPKILSGTEVEVVFQKIDNTKSFHQNKGYGSGDIFAQIDKREESAFLYYYLQALDEVSILSRKRILDIGANSGDELVVIDDMAHDHDLEMVGIDIDPTALDTARSRLPDALFYEHDINDIDSLQLGRFDLLISIATLQSPGINTKTLVMNLVQNYMTEDGGIIFGFPSSRWIDGELIYGAKAPNYPFSEISLVIKDIYWIKKYLQQHRFRVRIFGREYLFLVATKISNNSIKKKQI